MSRPPAAAIAPGATLEHIHEKHHARGTPEALEDLPQKLLGVSLRAVQNEKLWIVLRWG